MLNAEAFKTIHFCLPPRIQCLALTALRSNLKQITRERHRNYRRY